LILDWLEKDPQNIEIANKAEAQIICYGYKPIWVKMINLNPCEICEAKSPHGICFTEGERFSGASFGDNLQWCGNCGQCNHTKYDEY